MEADTGAGLANCVVEEIVEVLTGETGDATAGVADWKSSNSSSSAPPDCNNPKSVDVGGAVCLPLEIVGTFTGSSLKSNKSTSGSFGLGLGLVSALGGGARDVRDVVAVFLDFEADVEDVAPPSLYSSYSSNWSR